MDTLFNSDLNANNVIKLNFPLQWLDSINAAVNNDAICSRLNKVQPQWNGDICWMSPNTLRDFKIFDDVFSKLNIANVIRDGLKLDFNLQMYCGFFVIRSRCHAENYHTDWLGTGLKAFTLITPLVAEGDDFGLLYKKSDASIGKYFYKPGEIIVFAEGFLHSSMPSSSNRKVVLLSYTFGTDDISLLPLLIKSIGTQSNVIRLPNGDFRIADLEKC